MPSVQVTLRLPNNTISYQTFDTAMAHINPRNILQIVRGMFILAEFPPEAYLSWQYVASPIQQPSRAAQLLQPQSA